MDIALNFLVFLVSAVGLGLSFVFMVRWLKHHRALARSNGFALTWKNEVKQSPEFQIMKTNRRLCFLAFFATLVVGNGLHVLVSVL